MAKIKTISLVVGIVLIVIAAFIFFNNYSKNASFQVEETNSDGNIGLTGGVKEFMIVASRFKFEPSQIEVNEGDKVRITAYSEDVPHGLAIFEFDVYLYLEDTPKTIEFVADKKGNFEYFCNTYCGEGHGNMKGQLKVN